MDTLYKGILALLKSAITGEIVPLPEQFNIEQAYPILRKHSVLPMGYAGAIKCGISKEHPVMQLLRRDYFAAVLKSENQLAAIRTITQHFDAAGIDYMLLKGSALKSLYPVHEYRMMGDADILIRMEQYATISSVLEEMGYALQQETDYELVWVGPKLHLELHKRPVSSGNREFFHYYGDGWTRAMLLQGSQYTMTAEDQYVYLIMHLAKHYRAGGVGLRHVLDLWVYREKTQIDMEYVRRELEKINLLAFFENILQVIDGWFLDKPMDEKAEFITDVIFHSGNWGTAKQGRLSAIIRNSRAKDSAGQSRRRRLWRKIFPKWSELRYQYALLDRAPVLLPIFWCIRLATIGMFRRKQAVETYRGLAEVTEQEIVSHEQALAYVGLYFEKE